MPEVTIRAATLDDITMLIELCRKSFYDAWIIYNTAEDINVYMDEYFSPEKIREEILNPNETYYAAFKNGQPVGYAKFRRNYKEGKLEEERAVELQRVYIHPDFLGQKIGSTLIQFAIDQATKEGFDVIWLGVWENNIKAMELYKRFGFAIYDDHYFLMGNDRSHDWLMKKALK